MPPDVARHDPGEKVDDARRHQDPTCQKVQAAPPAVVVEDRVRPLGADGPIGVFEEGPGVHPAAVLEVPADRQFEQGRRQVVSDLAPIQPRVGPEDGEPGECQRHEAQGDDPVGDPDPGSVPVVSCPRLL